VTIEAIWTFCNAVTLAVLTKEAIGTFSETGVFMDVGVIFEGLAIFNAGFLVDEPLVVAVTGEFVYADMLNFITVIAFRTVLSG
jgi:hypothetical protein